MNRNFRRISVGMVVVMALAVGQVVLGHGDNKHEEGSRAKKEKTVSTFRGEIVDILCNLSHGGQGEKHAACALKCIKDGLPVGLLEEKTGKVFLLVGNDHKSVQKKMEEFVAKQVEIQGKKVEGKGMGMIMVESVKAI